MPTTQVAPGTITVFGWARCRVVIAQQVFESIIEMNCVNSDTNAGKATIKLVDSDMSNYNAIHEGDEVEIYLSDDTPVISANKVWGGYVENPNFDAGATFTLTVTAKQYTQRLLESFTGNSAVANVNSFTGIEPGTAIIALMNNYQVDFTTGNVLTGTLSTLTMNFLNKSLFQCLQEICDMFGYVFYIDLNKVLNVRKKETVVTVPASDYLTGGVNIISFRWEKNKELMCNSVIVFGSGTGIVSNSGSPTEDAASIANYGRKGKRITISSLTTSPDCNNYANAFIAVNKDPLLQYKSTSYFLGHSEPLMYINVSVPKLAVSGQYQIREVKHTYNLSGISTDMTLGVKISDLTTSLGQLMSRVAATEIKAFA